jgi:hypothetical protein
MAAGSVNVAAWLDLHALLCLGRRNHITQRGNRGQQTFFSDDDYLATGMTDSDFDLLRRHEHTGRPLGDDSFLQRLESTLGRTPRRLKPGPKPQQAN